MTGASPGSSEYKVGTQTGKDIFPLQGALIHTHTCSDGDNIDTPVHLKGESLEYGKKPESSQKTHTDMGRTCKFHIVAWDRESMFFPPPHCNAVMVKKIMLFEGLLYLVIFLFASHHTLKNNLVK